MGDVAQFPKLELVLVHVADLPAGTRYKCEAPDWVVRKTMDDGETWTDIGRLDPTGNKLRQSPSEKR